MIIYIARHGQDDDSVRGGWSNSPLTDLGIKQSTKLAESIWSNKEEFNIGQVFSSDLFRAKQTADIVADKLGLQVTEKPGFREVNNGLLAGMDNKIAEQKYPGMYWRKLDFDEHYPNGESPKEFYERICNEWDMFVKSLKGYDKNVLLITHGGVINVIRCIAENKQYSNSIKYQATPCAEISFTVEV